MDKIANLTRRSALFRAIREYFYDRDFIEVETPVKIHAPAPEEFIESVRAEGDFLRTSPELAMKVMLADGFERIFQIGSCFRADEHGRRHREEFTMLEFYARGMEYREQAQFTAGFVAEAARRVLGGESVVYRGVKSTSAAMSSSLSRRHSGAMPAFPRRKRSGRTGSTS